MKKVLIPSFLAIGWAMSYASAQEAELPDLKLSEFKLGEHIFGDEVTMDNLKSRVVVIEEWGVQ